MTDETIPTCLFCQKQLMSTSEGNDPRIFGDYSCEMCQAEYTMYEDNKRITDYSLRSNGYRMAFNLFDDTCEIQKMSVGKYRNLPSHNFAYWRPVIKLNQLPPNVTPRNVDRKIKIFLLFS
jgi:hypothetical protein